MYCIYSNTNLEKPTHHFQLCENLFLKSKSLHSV